MAQTPVMLGRGAGAAGSCLSSLRDLAEQLGATIQTETVGTDHAALSISVAPDRLPRFRAALLLGGVTIIKPDGPPPGGAILLLTILSRIKGKD